MRTLAGFALFLLGTWAVSVAADAPSTDSAATSASAPAADAAAAQHQGLRDLKAKMEQALKARDIEAILANVDDNIVFTTMNGDVARGKEGIRQYFTRMMEGPDKIVESISSEFIPDELSILHGTDTAI